MGEQRRFLVGLTALAGVCVLLQWMTGVSELALFMTPLFLLCALLLSGRYVGEERILARWRAAAADPRRVRRRSERWLPRAVPRLRFLYEHDSFGVRGPPALLAPAA